MNVVKIIYTSIEGATKEVVFGAVTRFFESYTFKAKDLNVSLEHDDKYTVTDTELAELISAQITSIELLEVNEDDGTLKSMAILNDFSKVRDIRKEYNLNSGIVSVNCIFQAMLIEDDESASE